VSSRALPLTPTLVSQQKYPVYVNCEKDNFFVENDETWNGKIYDNTFIVWLVLFACSCLNARMFIHANTLWRDLYGFYLFITFMHNLYIIGYKLWKARGHAYSTIGHIKDVHFLSKFN
jgi:hypothetical protein